MLTEPGLQQGNRLRRRAWDKSYPGEYYKGCGTGGSRSLCYFQIVLQRLLRPRPNCAIRLSS